MEDKLQITLISKDKDKELLGYFSHLLPQHMTNGISRWEFVGAFYDNTPCGILAYIIDDETIIPWIYVDEAYRRRSIGSQMLQTLRDDLEDKLLFTGFSCEIVLDAEGRGVDLVDFFEGIHDFDIMPKYCIYEVLPEVYKETFANHQLFKNTQKFVSHRFADLPGYQKRTLLNNPKIADCYHIDQMRNWEESIEKDLSLCIMEEDKITGVILITDTDEERMSIEMLHAEDTKSMMKLLMAFGQELIHKNNGKSLFFRPVNDNILKLAEGFFSEIMVYGEVWEASTF